jgi:F-type H+-transporting ATPase subunit alpha
MPVEQQVMILYAAISGYLDDVPVSDLSEMEANFQRFIAANYGDIGKKIAETKELSTDTEEALKEAITDFKKSLQ